MGQSSTGTLRASPAKLVLSAFALVALMLSLFALANPVRATHTTDPAIADGTIAIFKQMCQSIGEQHVCNGRDTSLSGYKIDYTVQTATVDGETVTPGPVIHTITVTLGDNAGGGGNLGNGSQGRSIAEPFDIGTYLVCEVEVAYTGDAAAPDDSVPLDALPRPNESSGGANQFSPFEERCILVQLNGGAAELKFLDVRADLATKTGMKFHDLDADGVKDAGEPGLEGWVIYADLNGNSVMDTDEPSDTTDATGAYSIPIAPGTYTFREVQKPGWTCSFPATCSYTETLGADETSSDNDFGNWTTATKTGTKFNDLDADGVKDSNEPGLANWVIYADLNGNSIQETTEPSATTGTGGTYSITGLRPGNYTFREVQQTGWRCTFPATTCAHTETLTSGQTSANNDFGNTVVVVTQLIPALVIDKVANVETISIVDGVATPSTITWTLTYTLTNGPVTGAVITDTLPTGLSYVAGSASPAAGFSLSADGRTLTWNFATLATSGSVSFQTSVNAATVLSPTVNLATIDSNETTPDTGQDQVTVTRSSTLAGTPTPTPVVREGTLASSVPNTAMDGPTNQLPAALLAVLALGSLGYLGRRNLIGTRNRC